MCSRLEIRDIIKEEIDLYFRKEGKEEVKLILKEFLKEDDKNVKKKYIIEKFPEILDSEQEGDLDMVIDKIKNFISLLKGEKEIVEENNEELTNRNKKLIEEKEKAEKEYSKILQEKRNLETSKREIEEKTRKLILKKESLENDINMLEKEKRNFILIKEKLETEQKKLEESKKKIENKYNTQKNKLKGYTKIQDLYERYLNSSMETKNNLKDLLKSETVEKFMACCFNIGTMDDLWDYVNNNVKNGKFQDVGILREIFEYFIEKQNERFNSNAYRLIIPELGEEFDPTKHTVVDRKSSGEISEVVFPGYGNLERKSSEEQKEEERKITKVRYLAIVKVI